MTQDEILKRFREVSRWSQKGKVAAHKPLLLLLALFRVIRGADRWIAFRDVEPELYRLVGEFGATAGEPRPSYPWWRLRSDGIWMVEDADKFKQTSSGDVSAVELRERNSRAGFTEDVHEELSSDRAFACRVATEILQTQFSDVDRQNIADEIGLSAVGGVGWKTGRRPGFRRDVLTAYRFACSVCGFELQVDQSVVGLDAAHIKWVGAGGPCSVENGICLCSIHHILFDRGAFAIGPNLEVIKSKFVRGRSGLQLHLEPYSGQKVRVPDEVQQHPNPEYLSWHQKEIFRR